MNEWKVSAAEIISEHKPRKEPRELSLDEKKEALREIGELSSCM